MRTIFRSINIGLILAAILAVGAVTGFAQDPCTDAAGQGAASDNITALFQKRKEPNGYKNLVEAAKQFVEKYGTCESAKPMINYINGDPTATDPKLKAAKLPAWEAAAREAADAEVEGAIIKRFNAALGAKNWDEFYSSGKELLAKNPDKYRDIELAFGTIGYDEFYNKKNNKYNDDTIRYAKQSIADLESGKTFSDKFGVPKEFVYTTKQNAVGWMNLIIGYLTQMDKKDKAAAAPYLYKATQADSETKNNPIPYELIGSYYFDELNKLVEQIQVAVKDQKDTDTPEVAQQKIDNIKKLVAQSNGVAERAMDSFSRAFNLGKDPAYKAKMKQNVADAYKLRFGKTDGVDTWMTSAITKPFVSPTTPIAPISDPEPAKTEATATAPAPMTTTTTTTTTVKTNAPAKPAATPTKPATKPSPAKPSSGKAIAAVKKKTA